MGDSKIKTWIENAFKWLTIIFIIIIIGILILKYNVEGETNLPFCLSSLIIISNAEGFQEEQNSTYRWDMEVYQFNDIYLNIEKNKNYKEVEAIKNVKIDNIRITQPQIGRVEIYRPSSNDIHMYSYDKAHQIVDKMELQGEKQTDIQNQTISNQGGTILLRILNKTGKRVTTNEDTFEHSGKLLEKTGINFEEIKTKIVFDLTIEIESGSLFKSTIELTLPEDGLVQSGSASKEIEHPRNIVFKREPI